MYYPKQIPQLLNQNYRDYIDYQENHEDKLHDFVLCIWTVTSKETLMKPIMNTVLPDGCLDLMIDLNKKTIYFCGFDRKSEDVELIGDINLMGVRFKPGAIYALFNKPANEVMNQMIEFHEIDDYEIEKIFEFNTTKEQITFLTHYLFTKINKQTLNYIELVDTLYQTPSVQCVNELGSNLGYGNRQLQRIFLKNFGVTPKVLLNIIRLHKCLTLLFDKTISLQDIAIESGFYDQAHFIKEIKKYTGISPTELIDEYQK